MIKILTKRHEVAKFFSNRDEQVGLVPTMGNLHQGHLNLLEKSLKENDISIITIFVNPTQFAKDEDLDKYPRTFDEDFQLINSLHQQYNKELFIFYPDSPMEVYDDQKGPAVSRFEKDLEGELRPTHFSGVVAVVKKLFELFNPTRAYFGKKDYQQLIVIQDLVNELKLNIDIVPVKISREPSGLAMSSRNNYLSSSEKNQAIKLRQSLLAAKDILLDQGLSAAQVFCKQVLTDSNFNYFQIRNRYSFMPAQQEDLEFVILGNLQVGKTRLLDNIEVKLNEL